MRVLVIKTSSLGDIIHTLPALTDAQQALPNIQFDWVVERSFQMIPAWHPSVQKVIPVSLRSWRKPWQTRQTLIEIFTCLKQIRATKYDVVLDVQGLLKSVMLALAAKGPRAGFSWSATREKAASLFYQRRIPAAWTLHAVDRARILFSEALHYPLPQTPLDYGIKVPTASSLFDTNIYNKSYYVFLPYTTWQTKHWPIVYWSLLAKRFEQNEMDIILLPNNAKEIEKAKQIANSVSNVQILPNLNLEEAARVLSKAKAAIGVDTGLSHLASALGVPTLTLYGPTDPKRSGTKGQHQIHLTTRFSCSPCLSRTCRYQDTQPIFPPCFTILPPDQVFEQVQKLKGAAYSPTTKGGSCE